MRSSTRLVVIGLGIVATFWVLAGVGRGISTHSEQPVPPAGSPQMSLTATPTTQALTPRTQALTITTWPTSTTVGRPTSTIRPTDASSRVRPLPLPPTGSASACPQIPDVRLLLYPAGASLGADPGSCTAAAAVRRTP
jgi:hypothetical protein